MIKKTLTNQYDSFQNSKINKFINANITILEANSKIKSVFQLLSKSIASWIIVSSKCVDGLSNGNLLFSAKNTKNNVIAKIKEIIDIHKSLLFEKKFDIPDKFISQFDKTTNQVISNIVIGSLIDNTNPSLEAHNHQKYVELSIQ